MRRIEGWLAHVDLYMLELITRHQKENNIVGSVCEIGVHHGKTLIALSLLAPESRVYAIDVFDQQEFNLGESGRGDLMLFKRNMTAAGCDLEKICIDIRQSQAVQSSDILGAVGGVRLFHIDGSHLYEDVISDVQLAQSAMADGGVIVVDDIFRSEWPEVTLGVFSSKPILKGLFTPFAIGHNKIYLCSPNHTLFYKKHLRNDSFLSNYFNKTIGLMGSEVDVYQEYLLSEFGFKRRISYFLDFFYPNLSFPLRKLKRKIFN